MEAAQQLRPDVVMVDLLLQGKVTGPQLIEGLRDSELDVPVVVLTVPQHPLARDPDRGIDASGALDPWLGLAAQKYDLGPPFHGWLDELHAVQRL